MGQHDQSIVNRREAPTLAGSGSEGDRVALALEQYLARLEAGPVSRAEFLAEHSDIASELAVCLEGLHLIRSVAPGFSLDRSSARSGLPRGRLTKGDSLGDFRICREVGRGGMGVVYEALQTSLDRRVALKVLPDGVSNDARRLRRFRQEAQAAAQLQHANIVPVYSIGFDEGIHYYTMQFVEGISLAQFVALCHNQAEAPDSQLTRAAGRPSPTEAAGEPGLDHEPEPPTTLERAWMRLGEMPLERRARWVAELGRQAAHALDHAHAAGVIHRDIKPANLLVDEAGHLWITDFGLARFQHEGSLTITGDLLGTLRYMSPEQVDGPAERVDHRSDVYSLGVTLYELLTLKPAVPGRSRTDLIRQITSLDPVRPRQVEPSIPRDLERIVLRAMAKNPDWRYSSAAELAGDLERFLDGRPLSMKSPSLLARLDGWHRQRPKLAATTTVVALLVGCTVALGAAFVTHARERATSSHTQSTQKLGLVRSAIDDLYISMIQHWHPDEPGEALVQNEFLERALRYYYELAAAESAEEDQNPNFWALYRRIGEIQKRLGRYDAAVTAYHHALKLVTHRLETAPGPLVAERRGAGLASFELGRILQSLMQYGEARVAFQTAIEHLTRLGKSNLTTPDALDLATCYLDLGILYGHGGDCPQAQSHFEQALKTAEAAFTGCAPGSIPARELGALVCSIESYQQQFGGQLDPAVAKVRDAVARLEALVAEAPGCLSARERLAEQYFRLAWMLSTDEPRVVRRNLPEAVRLAQTAIALDSQNPLYHHKLGSLQLAAGQAHNAETSFRTVLQLVPQSADARNSLAWALASPGHARPTDMREAVELAIGAVQRSGQIGLYWNTLGVAYYRLGNLENAIEALQTSMKLRQGGDSYDWFFLAMAHWKLGHTHLAQQWLARANEWVDRHRPNDVELSEFQAQAVQMILGDDGAPSPGITAQATQHIELEAPPEHRPNQPVLYWLSPV